MNFRPSLRLIAGFLVIVAFATAGHASPITYQVNRVIGAGRVTGFIQTDGTIGVLGAANFLNWDLILKNGISVFRLTGPLSGGNSSIFVRGTDVAAFDSFLLFNFSGIDYGILMFKNDLFSGLHYYCDSTQPFECAPGETVAPDGNSGDYQNVQHQGIVVIGTTGDPIPEPVSFILLCSAAAVVAWKKDLT
jgi:hypothetical protein